MVPKLIFAVNNLEIIRYDETSHKAKQNVLVGQKVTSPTVHCLVLCIYLTSRSHGNQCKQPGWFFVALLPAS